MILLCALATASVPPYLQRFGITPCSFYQNASFIKKCLQIKQAYDKLESNYRQPRKVVGVCKLSRSEEKTRKEPLKSIHLTSLEQKMPAMGKYFLSPQDREYLITIVDTVINSMSTHGIANLLRGKLPDPQINRIHSVWANRSF
jgi:hypothetical protein